MKVLEEKEEEEREENQRLEDGYEDPRLWPTTLTDGTVILLFKC